MGGKGIELLDIGLEEKPFSWVKLPQIQVKSLAGEVVVQEFVAEMLGRELLAQHQGDQLVTIGVEFFGSRLLGQAIRSQEQQEQDGGGSRAKDAAGEKQSVLCHSVGVRGLKARRVWVGNKEDLGKVYQ